MIQPSFVRLKIDSDIPQHQSNESNLRFNRNSIILNLKKKEGENILIILWDWIPSNIKRECFPISSHQKRDIFIIANNKWVQWSINNDNHCLCNLMRMLQTFGWLFFFLFWKITTSNNIMCMCGHYWIDGYINANINTNLATKAFIRICTNKTSEFLPRKDIEKEREKEGKVYGRRKLCIQLMIMTIQGT